MACICLPSIKAQAEIAQLPLSPRLAGAVLLAGSVGTLFQKGFVAVLYTPVALFFLFVLLSGIYEMFF